MSRGGRRGARRCFPATRVGTALAPCPPPGPACGQDFGLSKGGPARSESTRGLGDCWKCDSCSYARRIEQRDACHFLAHISVPLDHLVERMIGVLRRPAATVASAASAARVAFEPMPTPLCTHRPTTNSNRCPSPLRASAPPALRTAALAHTRHRLGHATALRRAITVLFLPFPWGARLTPRSWVRPPALAWSWSEPCMAAA